MGKTPITIKPASAEFHHTLPIIDAFEFAPGKLTRVFVGGAAPANRDETLYAACGSSQLPLGLGTLERVFKPRM